MVILEILVRDLTLVELVEEAVDQEVVDLNLHNPKSQQQSL